jgi:hypothetical protein
MKAWDQVRSFGLGGFMCGGLLGLLFMVWPDALPPHASITDALLVGGFLGAGSQRLLANIFQNFYSRLLQLSLLRPVIGEQTYNEILRELALHYFLGGQHKGFDAQDEKKARALPPKPLKKE